MNIRVTNTRMHFTGTMAALCRTVTWVKGLPVEVEAVRVTDATLVLVECKPENSTIVLNNGSKLSDYIKPILISETEKIGLGDWYVDDINQVRQSVVEGDEYWNQRTFYKKILALPEHFSPKQLQDIVNGKMKEVLVECEPTDATCLQGINEYEIKLNSQSHITLYQVEQKMYTREEMLKVVQDAVYVARSWNNCYPERVIEWFELNVK